MKLLLLALLSISCAKAAAPNKIHLAPSKADIIALKSAQLIEYKFKIQDPAKSMLYWHYELQIQSLQDELSTIITHK